MEIIKSFNDLKIIIRTAVCMVFGLDPEDPENDVVIRFGYGAEKKSGSQPGFERNVNVCTIYILPVNDQYDKQTEITHNPDGMGGLTRSAASTNVHDVRFVCYGPDAYEWARDIRAGLYGPEIKEYLDSNNIYLVSGAPQIQRAPELKDGQWWNRYDASVRLYELTVREAEAETIESVGIKVYSDTNGEERIIDVASD